MAAREIECDAEIMCQSDNFHRSDIQDIFFSSRHRTVVEHLSSTSSKKRPAGIRLCGCRAQRLQCAPHTSDTTANFVERHFFLLMLIHRLRREERKRRQELGLQAPYIIKLLLRDDSHKGNTPATTSLRNNPCAKFSPTLPSNLCNRNT